MVQRDTWRCTSYQVIVSKAFFLLAGGLIGVWIAHALTRLYAAPGRRNYTWSEGLTAAPPLLAITAWVIALHPGVRWSWGDGLGWWQVLFFFLVAVFVRFAIGIASTANVRRALLLSLGLPTIFACMGYVSIALFRLPPVGHGCPSVAPPSACTFHPLMGPSGPWVLLGLLAGLWLAYAVAIELAGTSWSMALTEWAIALPITFAAIWWALVIGPDQAGGGYVGRFVSAVCLTALIRLVLRATTIKKSVSDLLARFGIVSRMAAAPSDGPRAA